MPVNYLRNLTGHERSQRSNRHLGFSLAFIAGAVNAGGFLAVGQYTSHMTGIVSTMNDAIVLGNFSVAATAIVSVGAFVVGAATTGMLTNWATRHRLRSRFALSLLLEALLLLLFGLAGANLAAIRELLTPATILLLCYIMGLQNAVITKISQAEIRTTHVTGLLTDIGIELGHILHGNRGEPAGPNVAVNRYKLRLHSTLVACFTLGGISGAMAFKHVGVIATVPLAAFLACLAVLPIIDDVRYPRLPT